MKLSTKGRYGTRALLDLALHQGEGPIRLRDIAERQHISLPYLEHLITPLIAGGIVRSARGARGGVFLARSPEQIKLSEVIQLVEGSIAPVDCIDDPGICSRVNSCWSRVVWLQIRESVYGLLSTTSIQDLIDGKLGKPEDAEGFPDKLKVI